MNFRKTLAGVTILLALTTSVFAKAKKADKNSGKIKIVTTIFPQYDWTREIIGDTNSANLTLLIGNGTDLHSYQPSIQDIAKISTADIFIYVGGESDEWVEKAVSNAKNKNMTVVNMLEVLGDRVREEEIVEGMEHEHHDEEHHHDADHHHDDDEEEEIEYDEHVWLSLKNAAVVTEVLCEKIVKLDSEYERAVLSASKKTVLFGDRFPFRYLTDDYGLKYYAAFVGCSAESEASFETITFLAKKCDELNLNSILTIEKSDKKIAKTIASNTKSKNQEILEMDSLQSITKKEIESGRNYLSAMKNNLEVLKKALK